MPSENPELAHSFPDNPKLKLKPFYHTNLQNNLENIVFKAEPEREKGILEKVCLREEPNAFTTTLPIH